MLEVVDRLGRLTDRMRQFFSLPSEVAARVTVCRVGSSELVWAVVEYTILLTYSTALCTALDHKYGPVDSLSTTCIEFRYCV